MHVAHPEEKAAAVVSVIVGAYNHERYIAQALHSIIAQDAPFPIEVFVVEDASTDRTLDVIAGVQRSLDPDGNVSLTVLASPINLNTNRTWRATVQRTRGEFVATLDGDDYWSDPHKLVRQVQLMRDRPEVAMCVHAADYLDDSTGEIFGRSEVGPDDMTLCDVVLGSSIPACSVLFRRSAVLELPDFFDDAPYGDVITYVEAARRGPIAVIEEAMGVYRFHGGGLWNGAPTEVQSQRWLDCLAHFDPEVRARCSDAWQQSRGYALRQIASARLADGRRIGALSAALRAARMKDGSRRESVGLALQALPQVAAKPMRAALGALPMRDG